MREASGKQRVPPHKSCAGLIRSGLALLFVATLFLLTACTAPSIYQDDRYNPPVYWGQHVVRPGETLYSIAWRYGRDYRELGDANDIGPPWTIKAGQVLRLDKRGDPSRVASGPSATPETRQRNTSVSTQAGSPEITPCCHEEAETCPPFKPDGK